MVSPLLQAGQDRREHPSHVVLICEHRNVPTKDRVSAWIEILVRQTVELSPVEVGIEVRKHRIDTIRLARDAVATNKQQSDQ
jgi:hypothetical protein